MASLDETVNDYKKLCKISKNSPLIIDWKKRARKIGNFIFNDEIYQELKRQCKNDDYDFHYIQKRLIGVFKTKDTISVFVHQKEDNMRIEFFFVRLTDRALLRCRFKVKYGFWLFKFLNTKFSTSDELQYLILFNRNNKSAPPINDDAYIIFNIKILILKF